MFVVSVNDETGICLKKAEGGELEDYPPGEHHEHIPDDILKTMGRLAATQYYCYDNIEDSSDAKEYLLK